MFPFCSSQERSTSFLKGVATAKPKPNPKSGQIWAPSSKAQPNFRKENPWISFAESSLINELR
jgi:hypothetical protein